jgi:hypothetical protein
MPSRILVMEMLGVSMNDEFEQAEGPALETETAHWQVANNAVKDVFEKHAGDSTG